MNSAVYYTIQKIDKGDSRIPYYVSDVRYKSQDKAEQALHGILEAGQLGEIVQHVLTVVDSIDCAAPLKAPISFDEAWNIFKYENIFRRVKTKETYKIEKIEMLRGMLCGLETNKVEGTVDLMNQQTKKVCRYYIHQFSMVDGLVCLRDVCADHLFEVLVPTKFSK